MSTKRPVTSDSWRHTYNSVSKSRANNNNNPRSIHFRSQQLSVRESTRQNIFTSIRPGTANSLIDNGNADVRKVPSLLKDNVRLFTTEQLDTEGLLYMKEGAFYNRTEDPEYALSVSPHIYRKMVDEVNDSYSVPFGLYFCCHGGDGAHSGVAHDDNVDIGVAYIFVVFFFVVIMTLGWVLPMPVPH